MKLIKILTLNICFLVIACAEKSEEKPEEENTPNETQQAEKEVMLTSAQYDALDIKVDTLTKRMMSGFVEANGHLEVPPQSEATVTPVIGGNVSSIKVIEGDVVEKGSLLAYLSHPDIIKVQTEYINTANRLEYLRKDFARQKKLYEAGVGSGETFQKAESELQSAKGHVKGMEAQLRQLHINPESIRDGDIQQQIPILSPINGAIQKVNIKTGQFVQAQTNMFEIINTHHVHADLMVFEKDVAKVEKGQKVYFNITSQPGKEWEASILSIGKNFEQEPKALHVHAEIKDRTENLVPGMYVRGRIAVEDMRTLAFPVSAIARNADKFFVFSAEREGDAWSFKPIEISTGAQDNEWIEVRFLEEQPADNKYAFNNAYYLMAEMNKGEGGGHHH
ncbi:efflux RND transporter periplasmic adaptor subunit [Christiangramia echinicola]|uniref:Membrane fusion protein, cobalt-zinc-cadmium efflux system n=1 Tax=Christiangramia echinicola TaxID=279359 RepID=A0A1H1QX98_9FLAO|nr:efflux RND transporter periplasmic adaptor subunit [Christiangramia echinicola]SDS28037.1 membrane fusion protein, cobalt-zinc-cadmium efflux system [Christiangramia echinicola]